MHFGPCFLAIAAMSMGAGGRPCGLPLRPLLNGRPTGIPSGLRAPDAPLLAVASEDDTLSASMPPWLRHLRGKGKRGQQAARGRDHTGALGQDMALVAGRGLTAAELLAVGSARWLP
jgi:hypothetical protein